MNFELRAKHLSKTEAEIMEEMASALGRIGRKLEGLIGELNHLQARMKMAESSPKLLNRYNEVRKQAHLYYYYLIVQREAIGLTNHDLLPKLYPIPPKPGYKSNRNEPVNSIL